MSQISPRNKPEQRWCLLFSINRTRCALTISFISCKSKPIANQRQEARNGSTQGKGNEVPSAAPPAAPAPAAEEAKNVVYRNLSDGVRFVGSDACAPCHLKIYKDYMRTPHGQAATLRSQRPELRDLPTAGITICKQNSTYCFRVFRENGAYFVSEFEQPGIPLEEARNHEPRIIPVR